MKHVTFNLLNNREEEFTEAQSLEEEEEDVEEAEEEEEEEDREVGRYLQRVKPRYSSLLLHTLAISSASDAVELVCIANILPLLPNLNASDKAAITSSVFMGMLIGGLLCGALSNTSFLSRKTCLEISLFTNGMAGILSALSSNLHLILFFRLLGGIGIGGAVPVVFSIAGDFFPLSSNRTVNLTYIAMFWMVGSLYSAILAFLLLSSPNDNSVSNSSIPNSASNSNNTSNEDDRWRIYAIFCSLPALLALLLNRYFTFDSPQYLLQQGRLEEARNVLEYITGESAQLSTVPRKKKAADSPWTTFRELFTFPLGYSTLIFLLIWFCLCFGSYGIPFSNLILSFFPSFFHSFLYFFSYSTSNLFCCFSALHL